ncbi:MAG: bifunctional phosphopantothenoylcysteine decarboxylase/phosphopantothenate--cysteine ligase CoaBC [Oscillibacter sp.]|nr:bifunctional phosphopantothenoylcysteine decarboxylase/phosphopantothenate--cysteine ligase CoaBC [Oscillibacter sp.]
MKDLQGKCVVLGVTGGIAAYKMADTARLLVKMGAEVHVVMTENAARFITPLTFESLTNQRCVVDTFARDFQYNVAHISLAKAADLILIAPATANVLAKLAHGVADDMLTTVVLAARCKKLAAPSMNTAMLENPVTQDNLAALQKYGFEIVEPAAGLLACGDVGKGKLPPPEELAEHVLRHLAREKTLQGVRVTVTAGPTQEALDPVRFLTNHSSGKMGYAIAREAMLRGAAVTLISGPVALEPPPFVQVEPVVSAKDMFLAVQKALPETDILIKAAAVADYRPATVAREKMKKQDHDLNIALERTDDILRWAAQNRHPGLFVCGFSMETENVMANSREKLEKKKLDMIAVNDLRTPGAGFGVDTNAVTLLTPEGREELPLLSKAEAAARLLDAIEKKRV